MFVLGVRNITKAYRFIPVISKWANYTIHGKRKTLFCCEIHVVLKVTVSVFHHILFHLPSITPKYAFINKLPGELLAGESHYMSSAY